MPKYMLILHDDMTALSKISPDEMQRVVAKYMAWSDQMARAGHLRGGEKLCEEGGKHLTAKGGTLVVKDGPFAEAKEIVGGYFMIEAKDYAEATSLSADCPHLALGGRIELREIDPMPEPTA
jgi:hypothetical protein